MSNLKGLARACGAGALSALALASIAFAQDAAIAASPIPPPTVNPGNTAFMMIATVLVLLMTVPGLALFYGGLVRTKNMLSVLMQVFAITCVIMIVWVFVGYSIAFTGNSNPMLNPYFGGLSKMFLMGVTPNTNAATFSNGVYIPEYVYVVFQMTFAAITPGLIIGVFAERIKFSGMMLFMILWSLFVYCPIAHIVWYWGGPDIFANAAFALQQATTSGDATAISAAQAAMDAVSADVGLMFGKGALDFAGGTVVHINAGIAGFVLCLLIGPRIGFGKDAMPPHSLVMTMIGASLLWVGWFGFNVGSNLEANGTAGLAMINTFLATAMAGLSWAVVEWIFRGHPSLLGLATGVVAGLVAVTPACGWIGPMGAIVLGLIVSPICYIFCTTVKNAFKYDDSLDVFGVHCIGGIVGALATGILCDPALGGTGLVDYTTSPGTLVTPATYDMAHQLIVQAMGVGVTLAWSGIGAIVIYYICTFTVGMRVTEEQEREGLDIASHGERAYNM